MTTIYSDAEVAKHNTKSDLWVIIHNKVYDITSYLEDHPGGVASLVEVAGQNATQAFEDLGHTENARKRLEQFLIGKLDHDEDSLKSKVERHLPPIPAGPFIDPALVITVAELLSLGAIVTIGVVLARRFSRNMLAESGWRVSPALSTLLPWVTSTSLASLLIHLYMRRAHPKPPTVVRPTHFKVQRSHDVAAIRTKLNNVVLKPQVYVDLPISKVEKLSSNTNKIIIDLPEARSMLGLPVGQHLTIRTTIGDQEISRPYTPTSSNKDLGRLELVIKNYDDGELTGQYLKNVRAGDNLSICGPKGQMHYRNGLAKSIGMVAGGTGITPMFQIIRAICENPKDKTQMVLIYANQTEKDILLRQELDAFVAKYSDQLKVHYILSKPHASWTGLTGRATKDLLKEKFAFSPADHENRAMICGPPGMVDNAKAWLAEMGYEKANTVSKMQDQIFIF